MEWPEDVVRLGHPTLNAGVGKCEWVRSNAGQTEVLRRLGFLLRVMRCQGRIFKKECVGGGLRVILDRGKWGRDFYVRQVIRPSCYPDAFVARSRVVCSGGTLCLSRHFG